MNKLQTKHFGYHLIKYATKENLIICFINMCKYNHMVQQILRIIIYKGENIRKKVV